MSAGNDKKRESDIAAVVKARYPGRNLYYKTADSHWYFGPSTLSNVVAVDMTQQDIGGSPSDYGVMLMVDDGTDWISDSDLTAPTLLPSSEAVKMTRMLLGIDEMPYWPDVPTEGLYNKPQKEVDNGITQE